MRLLALTALIAAAGSTGASAAVTPQQIDRFLPVARAPWPTSPCLGRERFTVVADLHSDGAKVNGVAWSGSCEIALDAALDDYTLCSVLTHEEGHLAGFEHSTDPRSIMFPGSRDWYQPCLDAAGVRRPSEPAPLPPGPADIARRLVSRRTALRPHCAEAFRPRWAYCFTRTRPRVTWWLVRLSDPEHGRIVRVWRERPRTKKRAPGRSQGRVAF